MVDRPPSIVEAQATTNEASAVPRKDTRNRKITASAAPSLTHDYENELPNDDALQISQVSEDHIAPVQSAAEQARQARKAARAAKLRAQGEDEPKVQPGEPTNAIPLTNAKLLDHRDVFGTRSSAFDGLVDVASHKVRKAARGVLPADGLDLDSASLRRAMAGRSETSHRTPALSPEQIAQDAGKILLPAPPQAVAVGPVRRNPRASGPVGERIAEDEAAAERRATPHCRSAAPRARARSCRRRR